MNKKCIYIISVILVILVGLFIFFTKKIRHANINWPQNSLVQISSEQDLSITITEPFKTVHGDWPAKTEFYISNDVIKNIEVSDNFSFYGFKFRKGALIEHRREESENYYDIYIKDKVIIDGLDLHGECVIEFKNNVLFSARCPEFEKVFFKRFIAPDALEYSADGEQKSVE